MRDVVFAYPGDLSAPTGGYGYDRALLASLRAMGHDVRLIQLPGAFPHATEAERCEARGRLASVDGSAVLIVDGLAYGALGALGARGELGAQGEISVLGARAEPTGPSLGAVAAPIVALVHHPLALETGLPAQCARRLADSERDALAAAASVVATSAHTADILTHDFGVPRERIAVAPPGLDPAWRAAERRFVGEPRVVSVGSVTARKGHDVLVAALARIADVPFEAAIIGSLDLAPSVVRDLRRQIEEAGLGSRVRLCGEVDVDAIRERFRAARLFALATRYEGFGMVFAEAMAAGLPVVGTAAGAVPSVVPTAAGRLVPVDDVAAMARAIREVLTDDGLAEALSRGARAASSRFGDWHDTARVVSDVVERLPAP